MSVKFVETVENQEDEEIKKINVNPEKPNPLNIAAFFDQFRKNPRELDGVCLETFIRELIADEVRQIRIQQTDNSKDFSAIRNQFVNDRVKVTNCDRSVKVLMRKEKEREDDPEKVTRLDINRL